MTARNAIRQAGLYGRTVARVAPRGLRERGGDPEVATARVVLVVGSPRSGTTFLAGAGGGGGGGVSPQAREREPARRGPGGATRRPRGRRPRTRSRSGPRTSPPTPGPPRP